MFPNCPAYSRVWEVGSHLCRLTFCLLLSHEQILWLGSHWLSPEHPHPLVGGSPAGLGSESILVWGFRCPVRPELQTSLCRASKMLSSSRCPSKTRVCVPVRHLRLGLCRGLNSKMPQHPAQSLELCQNCPFCATYCL